MPAPPATQIGVLIAPGCRPFTTASRGLSSSTTGSRSLQRVDPQPVASLGCSLAPHRTVAARPIGALGVERGLGGLRSRERAWRYLEAGLTLGMVAVVAHLTVPWERGLP